MENYGILLMALFVLVFGGLILAMVAVGTAAMIWLWVQIFKWARKNQGSNETPPGAHKSS
jgi:hypothetical protein